MAVIKQDVMQLYMQTTLSKSETVDGLDWCEIVVGGSKNVRPISRTDDSRADNDDVISSHGTNKCGPGCKRQADP